MGNISKFRLAGIAKICTNIPDSKSCYSIFSKSINGIKFSADTAMLAPLVFHICQTRAPACQYEIWSEILDDIKIENLEDDEALEIKNALQKTKIKSNL